LIDFCAAPTRRRETYARLLRQCGLSAEDRLVHLRIVSAVLLVVA
jgi:hypothetical protein